MLGIFLLKNILLQKKSYLCRRNVRGVVQSASILAWGASGRPFESGHSDTKKHR